MSDIINAPQADLTIERPANYDYILVDGSGSMYSHWASLMAAVDAYVAELGNLNTHIKLTQFDSNAGNPRFVTARDCAPAQWAPVATGEFHPLGGMTPLYDAINMMGRDFRDRNPIKASALVVTDGDENCSSTTQVQAKAILDWMRAKGYQITFIGCDFDNSRQAGLLGGNKASAIGVASARLIDATTALAKKRNLYAQFGAPMHWSEEDHQQFGGYLGSK